MSNTVRKANYVFNIIVNNFIFIDFLNCSQDIVSHPQEGRQRKWKTPGDESDISWHIDKTMCPTSVLACAHCPPFFVLTTPWCDWKALGAPDTEQASFLSLPPAPVDGFCLSCNCNDLVMKTLASASECWIKPPEIWLTRSRCAPTYGLKASLPWWGCISYLEHLSYTLFSLTWNWKVGESSWCFRLAMGTACREACP